MEHIIHNLSLNMQSSISQVSLSVKKGDTMRKLCITLTDNGTVYRIAEGCEAVLSAKKESGWILYNNCTIDYENNIIVYEFTHGTAIMPGKLDCEIKLYDANKNLITSPQFSIIVNNSVHEDGEVEDSNEFTELTEMVSAAKALKEEVETKLENGEFIGEKGDKGEKGEKGDRGPAPVKGVDYFTKDDRGEMLAELSTPFANAIKGVAKGKEITVYDVSPVEHTVRCKVKGKNLIPTITKGATGYGLTWTIDDSDGGVIANGTGTGNASFVLVTGSSKRIQLKKGKAYTLSCVSQLNGNKGYVYLQNIVNGSPVENVAVVSDSETFVPAEDGYASIGIVLLGGVKFTDEKMLVQFEEGNTATSYEPYIDPTTVTVTEETTGATYTPNADGTCDVVSVSPTMTLSTDNADVTIECEYNRDISAAFADLLSRSRISYIDLLASKWQGAASPYSQVVDVAGATKNSQVDLTPSVEQLSIFHNKDLAFVTENEDGVVTVYAIGQKPTNDYTIQVTITEVVR